MEIPSEFGQNIWLAIYPALQSIVKNSPKLNSHLNIVKFVLLLVIGANKLDLKPVFVDLKEPKKREEGPVRPPKKEWFRPLGATEKNYEFGEFEEASEKSETDWDLVNPGNLGCNIPDSHKRRKQFWSTFRGGLLAPTPDEIKAKKDKEVKHHRDLIEKSIKDLKSEALLYHSHPTAGKYELATTKPITSMKELNFASCEIKTPCMRIFKHPRLVYKYTTKGNIMAIISNGSDVSGLHGLGPLAAKPLMEGKVALYKRLAGV